MEEDRKKKKNKKKKGKQTKTSDVSSVTDGETASVEQNQSKQISGVSEIQTSSSRALESDEKLDRHQSNGAENKCLEEELKQVQLDKCSWILKETSLEEKITQLQNEKDSCMQKKASLKEKIEQLQIEKASCIQTEGGLQRKISQFQTEKDSWLQKEAALEDKIKHLESDKESWALKENSTKEMLTKLDVDRMGLEIKVEELEESRNHLLLENQRLMEAVSVLQLQIQNLAKDVSSATLTAETHDFKDRDANAQMEAANALVEKLVKENAVLVGKVNELYVQLDQRSVTAGHFSIPTQDLVVGIPETATVTDYVSELSEKLPESSEILESTVSNQKEDKRITADYADMKSILVTDSQIEELPEIHEAGEIEEIVQVSLDDNEIKEVEAQADETDGNAGLPLSDAPLIGAPFRLISFVAKYVSGADLVNKHTSNSSW